MLFRASCRFTMSSRTLLILGIIALVITAIKVKPDFFDDLVSKIVLPDSCPAQTPIFFKPRPLFGLVASELRSRSIRITENRYLISVCADGEPHEGTYCGRGPCNWLGYNCEGGCVQNPWGIAPAKMFRLNHAATVNVLGDF